MTGYRDRFSEPPGSGRSFGEQPDVSPPPTYEAPVNSDIETSSDEQSESSPPASEAVNYEGTKRNAPDVDSEVRSRFGRGEKSTSVNKFEEELDRSRKIKLWQRSNWTASIFIVFVLLLAYMNVSADVRGEYGGAGPGKAGHAGMIICSVTHSDGIVSLRPNAPLMLGEFSDDKIGQEVNLTLKPRYQLPGQGKVTFIGKINSSEMNGLIQDGMQLYTVALQKDPLASVVQQLRALIPGSNRQIDVNGTTLKYR
jgi:hypothetical protein